MSRVTKRLMDFFVSTILLIVLLPVLLIVAVLIRLNMGSPVLFRQKRPGLDGAVFDMVKFRTMQTAPDPGAAALSDADRLTSLGRFLRRTSLDELPELWNVLKGDMSLVGPRPLLVEYLPLYSARQARRHEVRPGITGWAQVNGRNALEWTQKFEYDVWYVEHQSLNLDLRILLMTIKSIFHQEGISAGDHVTMPRFTGLDKND
jgi:sugar transferase EpsL